MPAFRAEANMANHRRKRSPNYDDGARRNARTLRSGARRGFARKPRRRISPIIWHLAHIGFFEAYWILQKLRGEARPMSVMTPLRSDQTPREESKNLPSRREMEEFWRAFGAARSLPRGSQFR